MFGIGWTSGMENCVFKVYKWTISSRRPPDMDKMSVKVWTDGEHMSQVDCGFEVKTGDVCSSWINGINNLCVQRDLMV